MTTTIDSWEFNDPKAILLDAIGDAIKPDERATVSEWADSNRVLTTSTSPEPGLWRTSRTPYLREIMDALSPQDPTNTITFVKGAQVGGTECGNNWIGTIVGKYPAPTMMVFPTLDQLRKNSKTRLAPLLEETPALVPKVRSKASREEGSSLELKKFNGGVLVLATAGSPSALRSQPIKYLFLDEISAYDADSGGEGDPLMLAKARTSNFGRHKKIFQCSTPTVRGVCRIEQEFAKSDRRYYHIPCIHCGKKFVIEWDLIKYEKDEEGNLIDESVHLECPRCKGRIEEHHKTWFLSEDNGAEWIPTAVGEGLHKGYHLSSLYSPLGWNSWVDIAKKWISANKRKAKGDYTELKTFVNTALGETWEDPASRVSDVELWNKREKYPAKCDVPMGGVFLTVGCDVQKDRLEASTYAWGEQDECWAIQHDIFWGNPIDPDDNCWKKLDELIYGTKFRHESGKMLKVSIACVDSGSWSDLVYSYVVNRKQKGVYAVKGQGAENHPVVKASKRVQHGKNKIPVRLFNVGTFEIKRMLYLRLQAEDRMVHFPIMEDFDQEFFKQITAESMVTKYHNGFPKRHFVLPSGQRNEALDCFVYAYAAKRIYDPSIAMVKKQLGLVDIEPKEEPEPPSFMERTQQERRKRIKRPKTNNWINGWK